MLYQYAYEYKITLYSRHIADNFINYQFQYFDLASSVGGALSLWVGISLAMFFEVLEFVFDLVFNICRYCGGRRQTICVVIANSIWEKCVI